MIYITVVSSIYISLFVVRYIYTLCFFAPLEMVWLLCQMHILFPMVSQWKDLLIVLFSSGSISPPLVPLKHIFNKKEPFLSSETSGYIHILCKEWNNGFPFESKVDCDIWLF